MKAYLSLTTGDRKYLLRIPAEKGHFHETTLNEAEIRIFARQYEMEADDVPYHHLDYVRSIANAMRKIYRECN